MSGRRVEMSVESVRVHALSTTHVVILKELEADRYLPIWIGPWEASAIAMRLQGVTPDRPMTHDLFTTVIRDLGAVVREVLIADLADDTFHARLVLETADKRILEVDARPSDAVALAVRTGVRIFADAAVLDRAGVRPDGTTGDAGLGTPGIDEEKLSVFRDFVNSLDQGPGSGDEPREGPRPRDSAPPG